jgi:LmbE family N-acetylglucosaminyl deacetylase
MEEQKNLNPLDENWERALAVVAHPDDLEYGAASAVARWTSQGKQINYLMVSRGEVGIDSMAPEETGPLREEEELVSARLVGVETVEFLDYQDGVIEYGLPLRRDIARAIRRHRPNVLITLNFQLTWGGPELNMADHRWVGLAVLDASRDAANRWIFPE